MWVSKGWREGRGAGARIVVGRSGSVGGSGVATGVSLIPSLASGTVAKSFTAVSLSENLGCAGWPDRAGGLGSVSFGVS